jgi:hypothetical protein
MAYLTGATTNFLAARLRFPVGMVKGRKATKITDPTTMEQKATGLTKRRSTATSSGEGSVGSADERGTTDMDAKRIIAITTDINLFMNLIVFPHYGSNVTLH